MDRQKCVFRLVGKARPYALCPSTLISCDTRGLRRAPAVPPTLGPRAPDPRQEAREPRQRERRARTLTAFYSDGVLLVIGVSIDFQLQEPVINFLGFFLVSTRARALVNSAGTASLSQPSSEKVTF